MKYSLSVVRNDNDATTITEVTVGSAALVSYAAKEVREELRDKEDDFAVTLVELDTEGNHSKTLLRISADGNTVSDLLKVRLAAIRKVERSSAGATESDDDE